MRTALARTGNDTLKMSAYYYFYSCFTELNKDTSLYFAKLQRQAAQKVKRKLWEADALFQVSYIAFSISNYPELFNAITDGLAITDDIKSEQNNWHINTFLGDGDSYKARLFIAAALH